MLYLHHFQGLFFEGIEGFLLGVMVVILGIKSSPVIALYIGTLDSESTEMIYKVMRDINRKFSMTFVVITRDKK